MLWKIVILFLCAMVLVGMVGKLIFPNARPKLGLGGAKKCPKCKKPLVGRGPCACGGKA